MWQSENSEAKPILKEPHSENMLFVKSVDSPDLLVEARNLARKCTYAFTSRLTGVKRCHSIQSYLTNCCNLTTFTSIHDPKVLLMATEASELN